MFYKTHFLYLISSVLFIGCGEEYQPEKNTAPYDLLVSVETQGTPTTRSTLYCNASAQDDNFNDPLAMNVEWFNLSRDSQTSIGSGSILSVTPQKALPNEEVSCQVTFTDSVGESISGSASIVIENTLPLINELTMTPSEIHNDDILRCNLSYDEFDGELVDVVYTWYKSTPTGSDNGQKFEVSTEDVQPAQLNLNPEDYSVGDFIYCHVSITDPHGTTEDEVVRQIQNRAPKPQSIEIDYEGLDNGEPPYLNDTLFCLATGFDPDEEDPLVLEYNWSVGGSALEDGDNSSLSLSEYGLQPGDSVDCEVTFVDVQNALTTTRTSVTIGNLPPEITSVSIEPSEIHNYLQTVTCSVTAEDLEDDNNGLELGYSYTWLVDGVETSTGSEFSWGASDIILEVDSTLECAVSVTDSQGITTQDSIQSTVMNRAPNVDSVSVSRVGNDLICDAVGEDVDLQDITLSYSWSVNSETVASTPDQSTMPVSMFLAFDDSDVTCSVQANDGIATSDALDGSLSVSNTIATIDSMDYNTTIAYADSILEAVVAVTDPDENQSVFFAWFVNAEEMTETSSSFSGDFEEGDVVSYQVLVQETFYNETRTTASDSPTQQITILNSSPVISGLDMVDENDQEASLTSLSTLTSLFVVSDIDGSDEINCTYTIESDGTELVASTEVVDPSDISFDLTTTTLTSGDEIVLTVTCENPDEADSSVSETISKILE